MTLRVGAAETSTSPASAVAFVVRHRRAAAYGALIGAAIGLTVAFVSPRYYEAQTAVVPQGSRAGNVSGIAAQLGIPFAGGAAGDNAAYYAALVNSPMILGRIVDDTLSMPNPGKGVPRTLVGVEEAKGNAPGLARKKAIERLRKHLHISVDAPTNVLTVQSEQLEPMVAYQVAAKIVEQLNAFNVETRRQRASDEREFAEEQLGEANRSLEAAEARLRDFREGNRAMAASPALQLRAEELERDVQMRQTEYTNLAQAYEQARLESLRSSPVLTVIEAPQVPPEPESRHILMRATVGLVIGAIIGLVLAAARQFRSIVTVADDAVSR